MNPAQLSSYGINLEDVRTALTQASVNAAKGNFDGPRQDYQIDSNDQITVARRLCQCAHCLEKRRAGAGAVMSPMSSNGTENSYAGRLDESDARGHRQYPEAARREHHQSRREHQENLAAARRPTFPPSVKIIPLTDLTTSIQASISDVEFELMLTVGLVVLVIFLFLRSLRATIIPSVAVPVSLVGTFGVMYPAGLQPRQPLPDGADHLHRLRRGRRHRHDRKHHPLSGGGR